MEMQIFKNQELGEIRTLAINGEPYFVGRDVAEILGYVKTRNAIEKHVDKDDALKWGVTDNLGRTQETTIINESGLYSLILSSKLESAKKFKRWVTSEVLPSLRKHGKYETQKQPITMGQQLLMHAQYLVEIENEMSSMKKDLRRVEHNQRRITSNYLTVIAYANLNNIPAKTYNASVMGRKAKRLCVEKNILTGNIVDSRYGHINTYPIEILDEVFYKR